MLLLRIKKEVKIKNLRIHEQFIDFDPLRKGYCAANKFRGILSQHKIELSLAEYNFLEDLYRHPQDATKVCWHNFTRDINLVFAEEELEKDPLKQTKTFEIPKFLNPNTVLSAQEEAQLMKVLTDLGRFCFLNRILLKPHFQDKDRAKSGKIIFSRLRSILDFHKIALSQPEFDLICKRFAFEGFEFNYLEFVEVLTHFEHL